MTKKQIEESIDILYQACNFTNITLADLAKMCKVPKFQLENWFRGIGFPREWQLRLMEDTLKTRFEIFHINEPVIVNQHSTINRTVPINGTEAVNAATEFFEKMFPNAAAVIQPEIDKNNEAVRKAMEYKPKETITPVDEKAELNKKAEGAATESDQKMEPNAQEIMQVINKVAYLNLKKDKYFEFTYGANSGLQWFVDHTDFNELEKFIKTRECAIKIKTGDAVLIKGNKASAGQEGIILGVTTTKNFKKVFTQIDENTVLNDVNDKVVVMTNSSVIECDRKSLIKVF